jgi:hypothetical protein
MKTSDEVLYEIPGVEEQFDNLMHWLGTGKHDWDWTIEEFTTPFVQNSTKFDTPWPFDMEISNESSHSENDPLGNDNCRNASGVRLPNLPESRHEAGNNRQKEHISYHRRRIFSLSRYAAFGRVDIIVQTKSPSGYLESSSTPNFARDALEDKFEAKAIITSCDNAIAMPQVIFDIGNHTGVNSLSIPTLSFRSTIPDNSKIFQVAKFKSPRDLQTLIRDGLASLNDCDTNGRSLLNVSIIIHRAKVILTFKPSMLWQRPTLRCANFFSSKL